MSRLRAWKGRDQREMRGGVGGRDSGVAGLLDPRRPFMCDGPGTEAYIYLLFSRCLWWDGLYLCLVPPVAQSFYPM